MATASANLMVERRPFYVFIESPPITFEITLLFLACCLLRRMWSVNASAARVIISFAFLVSSSTSGLWLPEHPRTNVYSKRLCRWLSDTSEAVGPPGD